MGIESTPISRRNLIRAGFVAAAGATLGEVFTDQFASKLAAYQEAAAQAEYMSRVYPQSKFHAGFNVLIYENNESTVSKVTNVLDQVVAMNGNAVAFAFPFFQESSSASTIYTKPENTISFDRLALITEAAHQRKLSVMYKPVLDEKAFKGEKQRNHPKKDMWRGSIEPSDVDSYFDSMGAYLLDLAKVGVSANAETLSLMVEMNSLQDHTPHWLRIIRKIRDVQYTGQLTMGFNWFKEDNGVPDNMNTDFDDFLINELDFIGINTFYPINVKRGTMPGVKELADNYDYWVRRIRSEILTTYNKRVILTEAGFRSMDDSFFDPFNPESNRPVNLELQKREYIAYLYETSKISSGVYLWSLPLYNPQSPNQDNSFDVRGKPAEKVVRDFYQKICNR